MGSLDSAGAMVYTGAACACMLVMLMITKKKAAARKPISDLPLPPSPPAWPIIGHLPILQKPLHLCLHKLSQQYGPLYMLNMGSQPILVASSAQWAKELLLVHDRDLVNRPHFEGSKRLMCNSSCLIIVKHGPAWRHIRKLYVTQLLTVKRVGMFEKSRQEEMALVMNTIRGRAAGAGTVDIRKVVFSALGNMFTMMMFSKRLFDTEDALDGKGSRFKDVIEECLILLGATVYGDALPWLAWLDGGVKGKMDQAAKELDAFLESIIVERIESKGIVNDAEAASDYLDLLLCLYTEDGKTDKQSIKLILQDIMIAGTETTGSTIEWTLAELLNNPSCMTKLQEELDTLVASKESTADKCLKDADLAKLSYLQAVIKESLRLHPVISLNLRAFSDTLDEFVQVGGYRVPRNSRVLINNWTLGKDTAFWGKDANTFVPERFLNNSAPDARGQNFEYIPFGAGRRQCPGMNVALTVAPFILANLVQAMSWSMPNGVPLDLSEESAFTVYMAKRLVLVPSVRAHI